MWTRSFALPLLLAAFAVPAMAPAPAAAQGEPIRLNLCGASPEGLWQLLGVGLDTALKADNPDSVITYQTSSGGYANIAQMAQGKCDLAIIHAGEGKIAMKGEEPFREPMQDFKALMVLYDWAPMQWVMTKDFADTHGIKSLQDIAEKKPPLRLVLNRRGILPSQVGEASLEALGVTLEDIESWGGKLEFQGSAVASELMQNRRADMWANQTFVGHSSVRNIAEAVPVTLLDVPEKVVDQMAEDFGDKPTTIPAEAYEWLDEPVQTNAARALLVAPASMSEEMAQRITATVLANADKMQGVHPAMKAFAPQVMADQRVIPLHAGAAKAYSEAGMDVEQPESAAAN